jgi:DNA repair exonuclease SbcCD ATPase subunit
VLSHLLSAFCSSSFSLQAASEAAAKGQRELHALELREAKLSERDSSVAELKAGLSERLAALAANERELAQRAQQLDSSARQLEAAQAEINAERKAAATKAAEQKEELARQRAELATAQEHARQRLQALDEREAQLAEVSRGRGVCRPVALIACDVLHCSRAVLAPHCHCITLLSRLPPFLLYSSPRLWSSSRPRLRLAATSWRR